MGRNQARVSGPRYLIVKLAALGDVAMATTLPGAIKAVAPSAHVTWLCGTRVADLVRLVPDVDEVLVADEAALLRGSFPSQVRALASVWGRLGGRRFDVTLLGHADRRYRALILAVRSGRVRSLQHDPSRDMLPIPGRYHGDEYVRLLDERPSRGPIVGHFPQPDLRPRLTARRDPDAVGVVLVPGGTRNLLRESALRRWPVERYREVAAALRLAGHPVTLIGDEGDAWVSPFFEGLGVRDEIGANDLTGALAVLAAARLVITHDTGPLHLAQLVRAPLLGLFGPTIPSQFMLGGDATSVLWGGSTLACRPCYDGREFADCADNLCMQDIATSAVIERALAMLSTTGAPRHAVQAMP
jgi:heptosyltransferase II